MKKLVAVVLLAVLMVVGAITSSAGTINWVYMEDLGAGYSAGWLVQLYKDVSKNGFGAGGTIGADDIAVAGITDVLTSGKSGTSWGSSFSAPAGSLHLGDHVYTVIYNGPTAGSATSYVIVDAAPFVLPAADQDADYVLTSVSYPYKPLSVLLTATAGANGTISPSGSVGVGYGLSQTFSITAASDYKIADVLVDGSSVGATNSYTFYNVTASHTISATFVLNVAAKGTPIAWLESYGLTGDYNARELDDPDMDGIPTWQEYIAGTDPTNKASCFKISSVSNVNNGQSSILWWNTSTGRLYSVYSRTNLLVPPWITNAWRVSCAGTQLSYTNNGNTPAMFFRLGVEKQ